MSKQHSVLLKEDKCEGCTHCVRTCPTKAIRVHNGRAWIKEEYCIDCGECIRSCEHNAKYVATDKLEDIKNYKYPIILVPPSFYGQFESDINPVKVMKGLKRLGFKEIWDVALGAEVITLATREYLKENKGPIISSSCPAVVRLIQHLYPELLENLAPFKSPVEVVAQKARRDMREKGVTDDELGIFFITPCPAKMTTVESPLGMEKSYLDGAIAVDIIYHRLLKEFDNLDQKEIEEKEQIPYYGISWGRSGGEEALLKGEETISVSGIHNVMEVLDELDRGKLNKIKYFEMVSCQSGCVGGVLNVQNPFVAKFNIDNLTQKGVEFISQDLDDYDVYLSSPIRENSVDSLDDDFMVAMSKLKQIEEEVELLPGLDCTACGAPDCRSLAEDIVNGLAQRSDCIFILRQQIANLADQMSILAHEVPSVMKQNKDLEDDNNED